MSDVELSPKAAVVASKIRTIDRDLDQMEEDREDSILRGMRAPSGAAVINKWSQDRADSRREALLQKRAELASQLRKLVGDLRALPRHCLASRGLRRLASRGCPSSSIGDTFARCQRALSSMRSRRTWRTGFKLSTVGLACSLSRSATL
jgi:hypothetical protein